MEAARTSETSVENYFTRQYIPEDNSELRTIALFTYKHLMGYRKCFAFILKTKRKFLRREW
jgi:hypothetical protein